MNLCCLILFRVKVFKVLYLLKLNIEIAYSLYSSVNTVALLF